MSVAGPAQRRLARLRTAQQLRFTAVNGKKRNTGAGYTGHTFAIGRKRTGLRPQTKALGGDRARLATLEIHNVHPRGVTGFVAVEQQAFGIGEELTMVGNNVPGGKGARLSHAGGKQYEVWRRHVLPQHQRPLTIGRKSARRSLAQTDRGRPSRIAGEHRIVSAARLARLGEQHELSVLGDVEGDSPVLPAQIAFFVFAWRQADRASAHGVTRNQGAAASTGVMQSECPGGA